MTFFQQDALCCGLIIGLIAFIAFVGHFQGDTDGDMMDTAFFMVSSFMVIVAGFIVAIVKYI